MLETLEFESLRKYKSRRVVENERDLGWLDRARAIGLANCRYAFDENGPVIENGLPVRTAVLTPLGRRFVRRDEIYRSPVKRFFYKLANLFW